MTTRSVEQMVERRVKEWLLRCAPVVPDPTADARPVARRSWITLSRAAGSGGEQIAEDLAQRLGYEIVDRQILEVLTTQEHIADHVASALDEKTHSSLRLWVGEIIRGRLFDRRDYVVALVRVLNAMAAVGGIIVLGRGANHLLESRDGLHVRVVAPLPHRVRLLATQEGITQDEAERILRRIDKDRAQFVGTIFHAEIEDPESYDLMVNTGGLVIRQASVIIEKALREKVGSRSDLVV